MKKNPWTVRRTAPSVASIDNSLGVDVRLFANDTVVVERDAFAQLFEFLDVARAVSDVRAAERRGAPVYFGEDVGIDRVVLTPDFHRGSGIPVGTVVRANGFVIPKAIGNDVCCGMRLLATDLPAERLDAHWPAIQKRLRALFFRGERDIPMSPRQREALLRDGLPGLLRTEADNHGRGIFADYDPVTQRADLDRIHGGGALPTRDLFGFDKLVQSSGRIDGRDPQIGSVGGGNHFVEIQRVDELLCKATASALGVTSGNVAIMVHSGSVGLGHAVGGWFEDRARELFPKGIAHPTGDFFPVPVVGPFAEEGRRYLDAMGNAANFAFANRLFLAMMAVRALREATGASIATKLVYDAPHNLVFAHGACCLHRKGATPADGPEGDGAWVGQPVIIPGSMGASSYLLAGQGQEDALASACHGAGRAMPRGAAARVSDDEYERRSGKLRIVTPVDPDAPELRSRRDILERYRARVKEEAPYAYKPIAPVIDSVRDAGIARPVARMTPLCTVKG